MEGGPEGILCARLSCQSHTLLRTVTCLSRTCALDDSCYSAVFVSSVVAAKEDTLVSSDRKTNKRLVEYQKLCYVKLLMRL